MKTKGNMLRAVWYFLRQYPGPYCALFLIITACAFLENINIAVLFPLIQSILGQAGSAQGGPIIQALGKFIGLLPFRDPFMGVCALVIVTLVLKELLDFTREVLGARYSLGRVVYDAKIKVFEKYINSDYQFFLDNKQGVLAYRALQATNRIGNALHFIPQIFAAVLMTVSIGIILMSISFPVTMTLLAIGLAHNLLTQVLSKKVSYFIGRERVTVGADANVVVNEFCDGIKQIKVIGSADSWFRKFIASAKRFKELVIKDAIWVAVPGKVMDFLPIVILVSAALILRYVKKTSPDVMIAHLTSIGVYIFALYRLVPYLSSIARLRMQLMNNLPDVELVYDFLAEKTCAVKDGWRPIDVFRSDVRLEDVWFSYKTKKGILKGVSFSIEKGSTVAIVGGSGTGKSTLVNLLIRLFDPESGRILIDGVDLKEIERSSLIRVINLVSQETFVFNGSVRDNILFGLEEVSSEKMIEAAKLANAHEFITHLPEGYETIVGDKGLKLSGGQRQRIAIARAIVRDPQILILDEATSSLDHDSEVLVQQAINEASRNRTVITIAHRLSTVIGADKIIVLDQGCVVEQGSHDELMKQGGAYKRLHDAQEFLFSNNK